MTVSNPSRQRSGKPKAVASKPTRHAQLRKLLNRKSGASIAQIQKAFNWQPHTARAAISTLRKAGCIVARTDTAKGPVYRIIDQAEAV